MFHIMYWSSEMKNLVLYLDIVKMPLLSDRQCLSGILISKQTSAWRTGTLMNGEAELETVPVGGLQNL